MFRGEKRFNIIAALINIVVILTLFLDTYLIPSGKEQHTVLSFEQKHISGATSRGAGANIGYDIYTVNAVSGDSYDISMQSSLAMQPGDVFTITKSGLFSRDLAISYQTTSGSYKENIGKLNDSKIVFWSYILIGLISITAAIISYNNIKTYNSLHTLAHMLALIFSFFNLVIYFS